MLKSKQTSDAATQDKVMEAFKQWVAQKIQNGEVQESDLKDQNKVKQLFQVFQQELSKTQSAKMGAKLDYINQLNGRCPHGTHITYHKVGGTICKRCEADAHNEDSDPIKAFKQKCGGKVKKKEIGGEMADDNKDAKTKLVKKPKPVVKKPQPTTPPATKPRDNKRPGPKDLKALPNGKYPSYWTPDQRGQWDSMHPEEAV